MEHRRRPWEQRRAATPTAAEWQAAVAATLSAQQCAVEPSQAEALVAHLLTLGQFNGRLNLTSLATPIAIAQELLGDALLALPLLDGLPSTTLIDVGSGGGFPGLPLAVLRPEWTVELLERKTSIALYLEQAVQATGAGNVTVLNIPLEDYPRHRRDSAPACFTAKAVFHVEQFCKLLAEHSSPLDVGLWWGVPGLDPDTLPSPWHLAGVAAGQLGPEGRPSAVYLLSRA